MMKINLRMMVLFTIACTMLAAASCRAAPGAAVILAVQGGVQIKESKDGAWKDAGKGLKLGESATVRTGADGRVQLEIPGGHVLLFKEYSLVKLTELSQEKQGVTVPLGEFLIGSKTEKPSTGGKGTFTVTTPSAVAAVRGTLFWGLADEDLASTYACFQGSIALTSAGETVVLEPGTVSRAGFGQAPHPPESANIPLSYLDTFAIQGSTAGLKEMLEQ